MQQETTDTQEYQLAMESFLKGGGNYRHAQRNFK